ncbi:hypothetical protein Afe04nite_07630 [Asanoa ferruginea]|uniref:hypothetical protein n=1 Tax=Asanoa ferruginea TaxID=53367 RepID=UPI000E223D26|nr:hypothetical protein [Asanoa ferruginea]GIF46224.1 hypothetical protein Afe04nite_07630 [Asanoa ferruginea]
MLGDDEADTRYYAFYALVEEIPAVTRERVTAAVNGCVDDPDEQIREWATRLRSGELWEA